MPLLFANQRRHVFLHQGPYTLMYKVLLFIPKIRITFVFEDTFGSREGILNIFSYSDNDVMASHTYEVMASHTSENS